MRRSQSAPVFLVILLIEDEPGDALLVRTQLLEDTTEHYQVHLASSLAQAQHLIDQQGLKPDVVLLDLNLPDSRGLVTVERCRALCEAPIVVLTGLDDFAATLAAIQSGAEDFLTKGADGAMLRKALRYALLRYERDASTRLTAAVFASAHDGIMITSPEGRVIDVNDAFTRICGYSREEVLGQNPRILQSGRHGSDFYLAMWQALLDTGQWQGEIWNRRKNGEVFPGMLTISAVRNRRGGVQHYAGVLSDLSGRIEAERRLAESQQLLQTAVETVDEAFVIYDPQDRLVFFNEQYCLSYPISAPVIEIGRSFEEIIRYGAEHGEFPDAVGRVEQWVAERLLAHQRGDAELIQALEGARWIKIRERKTPNGYIVGFRVDVSEVYQAKEAAEAANRAKSAFLATMSHEIRTPMNGILGMAQLLLIPTLSDDERREYARTIYSSGQTLLTLLNDILDLSKVEAGKITLERAAFSPAQMLQEVNALYGEACQHKGLELRCDSQSLDPDLRCWGDPLRLRQILNNLTSNAIKFTEAGSVQLRVTCVAVADGQPLLRFAVSDTGIGIAPNEQQRLFKPFSQADDSTSRRFGGTGLGLAIIKRLVDLMGGKVGLDSTPGQGSCFWFEVPLLPVVGSESRSEARQATASNAAAGVQRTHDNQHILIVEDFPMNRLVIESYLKRQGFRISSVADGQQAVDWVACNPLPDVVLMDCQMPVLDGLEATRRIRRWEAERGNAQRLPIIALTADAYEEDKKRCLDAGMDDFLTKPVNFDLMDAAIERWLPQAEAAPAATSAKAGAVAAIVRQLPAEVRSQLAAQLAEFDGLLDRRLFKARRAAVALDNQLRSHGIDTAFDPVLEAVARMQYEQAHEQLTRFVAAAELKLV